MKHSKIIFFIGWMIFNIFIIVFNIKMMMDPSNSASFIAFMGRNLVTIVTLNAGITIYLAYSFWSKKN